MIRKILFILLIFANTNAFAQYNSLESILNNNLPFREKQKLASDYFHCEMEDSVNLAHSDKDDEYAEYKRWEWISRHCVMPDGYPADPMHDYILRNAEINRRQRSFSNWQAIGQKNLNQTPYGLGRVDAIACHPTDSLTLYIGTFCGGIWKTIDGGDNWIPLGDNLPLCSVGSISINPINPNIIYIVLGVNLANNAGLGIYKSTDAGLTWNPTSQTSTVAAQIVYNQLLIHPANPDILFSCQSNGLYKTTDAGVNWTLINNSQFTYLRFNPLNPNSIYACGNGFGTSPSQIFKSVNGGFSFSQLSNFSNDYFIKFSVTSADTNYIAVRSTHFSTNNFYLSTDNGNTFVLKNGNNTIDNGGEVIISSNNKNKMYAGYPYLFNSLDSGVTWNYISSLVHADTRAIAISPVNNNIIYFCNDGGVFSLDESTGVWNNLSNTLDITMFYDISLAQQDSIALLGGSQDNGTRLKKSSAIWSVVGGGDGMKTAINPTDEQTMYASQQYGVLFRTYDQWQTSTGITPPGLTGTWTTPYKLDPADPKTIYAGYHDVMKSVDEGSSWNAISNLTSLSFTGKIEHLDVSKSNSDFIYCCSMYYNEIYYTTNGGLSWANTSAPVSVTNYISGLVIDPKNENRFFILKDGYVDHDKILSKVNNGSTWNNISYNLPNVPVFCMAINSQSDSANLDFYIGTSIGVYYKKDLDTVWSYLGNGLPNTFVNDLEIRYNYNKLVAATFGRGIWQIDLPYPVLPTGISEPRSNNEIYLIQNIVKNELEFESKTNETSPYNFSVYDMCGKLLFNRNQTVFKGQTRFSINTPVLSNGAYIVKISGKGFNKVFKAIVQ